MLKPTHHGHYYVNSKPAPDSMAYSSRSRMIFSLLYVGSFRVLKHVDAVGRRSPSRMMPTRWIVNGGFILANPSGGGRSQLVTKRNKSDRCFALKDATTFQNRAIVGSMPEKPPMYLVLALMSSTSMLSPLAPLIKTWSSGSLNRRSQS